MKKSCSVKMFWLLAILFSMTRVASAFEMGCKIQPSQLNDYATGLTKIIAQEKRSLPDNIPVNSGIKFSMSNGIKKYTGSFEAFFRPSEDDFISFIPFLPLIGADVSRDRVVLYICAHVTENPEDTHMTIYFLRGYNLDYLSMTSEPWRVGTIVANKIYGPQLKVKAVPASLVGIGEVRKFFLKVFRYIPFVDIYFETFSLVQRVIANAFGDITGLGVERIELTRSFLRISSVVNLDSPREARVTKSFKLKVPELGPGAKAAAPSSFKAPDDTVLDKLDNAPIEYEEIPDIP